MKQKIAIQGVAGSFHETAAQKHFGTNIETVECATFKNLCDTMKSGQASGAVMAIENTIAGTLLPNYTLLNEYGFKVSGEVFLNIQMNLMALPGVELQDIQTVISHPIAIRQCYEFLWGLKGTEIIEHNDTAGAAKQVKEEQLKTTAAIANEQAAHLYGLQILEKRIETNKMNFTRFLVLSKEVEENELNNKASLSMQLGHEVGSLADVLGTFKNNGINLTKIQSVPIVGKPYEYHFHLDVEWQNKSKYDTAISKVLKQTSGLAVLGEYRKSTFKLNE
jgi:prephenate dehydratase